jgi:hypothetical protein
MSQTHNLDYYQSLYKKYSDYNSVTEDHYQVNYYLNPPLYVAHRVSTYLNNRITSVDLKNAYAKAGDWAVKIGGVFSKSLAKRIDVARHDPISTKTVLNSAIKVRDYFKPWAKRKPSDLPLIGRVDRGFIAFSQHIYTLSKDVATVLSLPDKLHSFMEWKAKEESKTAEPEPKSEPEPAGPTPTPTASSSLMGRVWEVIRDGASSIKNYIADAILWIIHQIGLLLKKVPFLKPQIENLEKVDLKPQVANLIERGKDYLHGKLIKKAHDLIEQKEAIIRKKATAAAAEMVARRVLAFTINMTVTTAIGYGLYCLSGYLPVENYEKSSYIRSGVGLALWGMSVLPILQGLPEDYKEDFNPEASTFKELKTLINLQNIHKLIKFLKNI